MDFPQWLQSRLTAHGFPVGQIDGVIGPITTAAIKAFQSSRGLEPNGMANTATVEALRSTSSAVPAAPARAGVREQWPTQKDVPAFYGAVGTNTVAVEIPFEMRLAWNRSVRVRKITLHKKVAASAGRVFEKIADIYTPRERGYLGIDIFGGSLNVRKMRGGDSYSMHSWAIAIDFDPERNQLNWGYDKAMLAVSEAIPFWRAWEAEGWVSLGRTRNFDWMHVQAARL